MPPFSEGSVRDYEIALVSADHTNPARPKFAFAVKWAGNPESSRSDCGAQISVAVPVQGEGIAAQYDAAYKAAIDMLQEAARKLDLARRTQ